MEVQPQLVLLQKTLLNIEGLGRQLYPELDLWATAQPILEEWTKERTNPRAQMMRLLSSWPEISEDILALPGLFRRALENAAQDASNEQKLTAHASENSVIDNAGTWTIRGAALLMAGVFWVGLEIAPVWVGFVGMTSGIVLMLWPRHKLKKGDDTT